MSQASVPVSYKSPLHQMTQSTPTCLWNDSASIQELTYSIEHGAVGATCNPVIVHSVLKKELPAWKDRIRSLIDEFPSVTEDEIAWQLVREISIKGAALLKPIFDREGGRNGRLSIQTDPRLYRDTAAIVRQAEEFSRLAPNMIVKIPVTRAGVPAIEEATYAGISINATVCFTLPQCIAVASAVERGMQRREREGKDISSMGPVCTIMVGRLDDWLKVQAEKEAITLDPGYLEWAGVAVFKKTYRLFRERGYRIRLLSAASSHRRTHGNSVSMRAMSRCATASTNPSIPPSRRNSPASFSTSEELPPRTGLRSKISMPSARPVAPCGNSSPLAESSTRSYATSCSPIPTRDPEFHPRVFAL